MIIQVSKQKQTMGQSGIFFGFYGFAKSNLYEMAFSRAKIVMTQIGERCRAG